jgi:hypothetical protein
MMLVGHACPPTTFHARGAPALPLTADDLMNPACKRAQKAARRRTAASSMGTPSLHKETLVSRMAQLAPLASALADPDRLRVFARVVLAGADGLAVEDLRAVEPTAVRQLPRLAQAGLVALAEDGVARARLEAFAAGLRPAPPQDRGANSSDDTVAQFFKDGRLTDMPIRPARRQAVLAYLTRRAFEPGESYTEPEVNIALRQYWEDYAALRRYLVEGELLTRSADGRAYRVSES